MSGWQGASAGAPTRNGRLVRVLVLALFNVQHAGGLSHAAPRASETGQAQIYCSKQAGQQNRLILGLGHYRCSPKYRPWSTPCEMRMLLWMWEGSAASATGGGFSSYSECHGAPQTWHRGRVNSCIFIGILPVSAFFRVGWLLPSHALPAVPWIAAHPPQTEESARSTLSVVR